MGHFKKHPCNSCIHTLSRLCWSRLASLSAGLWWSQAQFCVCRLIKKSVVLGWAQLEQFIWLGSGSVDSPEALSSLLKLSLSHEISREGRFKFDCTISKWQFELAEYSYLKKKLWSLFFRAITKYLRDLQKRDRKGNEDWHSKFSKRMLNTSPFPLSSRKGINKYWIPFSPQFLHSSPPFTQIQYCLLVS